MAATDDFIINSNGLGYIAPSSEKKHASGVQVQSRTGVKGDDTMEVRFEFGYVNMSNRSCFFFFLCWNHISGFRVVSLY